MNERALDRGPGAGASPDPLGLADPPGGAPLDASTATRDSPRERPDTALRVRVIYTRYPHWGAHSGMTQFARYVDPQRVQVELRGASDDDEDLRIPPGRLRDAIRARVQRGGMAWYKLSDLSAELRALAACAAGRARLVHFLDGEHSVQYLPAFLRGRRSRGGGDGLGALRPAAMRRLARARTVATFHQPPGLLPELVNPRLVAALDCVTVVAPTQVGWFREFLPPERVHVLPHGVDTEFFRPRAPDPDAAPRPRPLRCITAGHWLRDWEAVRAVAERLRSDPGIAFDVVTSKPTGLDGLPNVVHHRGVDDLTLRRLYQDADVLFLPLTDSTANNSLLEGIASGLPVVTTDLPAVRAYVPDAAAVFVERNDTGTLADAVSWLARDGTARAAMGAQARARAEQLAWPAIARRIERLYEQVASAPGGRWS